jgi:ABC-type phosphate transport system substrate-binding protein
MIGDFTGGDCATLFQTQVRNTRDGELELLAGRRLSILTDDDLEIDFAISNDPMAASVDDLMNFPVFVYGIAPVFNIPGVDRLKLTEQVVARIFRGCKNPTPAPSALPSSSAPTFTTSPSAAPTIGTATPSAQPTTLSPTAAPEGCLPGSILYWDDAAILATNPPDVHPYLQAAGKIKVFVHSHADSGTYAFKRALSTFDPDFYTQIGDGDDNSWTGTEHTQVVGDYGTLRTISATPSSIGFDDIHQNLRQRKVIQVELVDAYIEGKTVRPNTESLYAAFYEIGLAFGNDGNPASQQTLKLTEAIGSNSWPISRVAYMSTRVNHTPENCLERKSGLYVVLALKRRVHAIKISWKYD